MRHITETEKYRFPGQDEAFCTTWFHLTSIFLVCQQLSVYVVKKQKETKITQRQLQQEVEFTTVYKICPNSDSNRSSITEIYNLCSYNIVQANKQFGNPRVIQGGNICLSKFEGEGRR